MARADLLTPRLLDKCPPPSSAVDSSRDAWRSPDDARPALVGLEAAGRDADAQAMGPTNAARHLGRAKPVRARRRVAPRILEAPRACMTWSRRIRPPPRSSETSPARTGAPSAEPTRSRPQHASARPPTAPEKRGPRAVVVDEDRRADGRRN